MTTHQEPAPTGPNESVPLLTDRQGLAVLSMDECVEKLKHQTVGRVGFSDAGETIILPVNYAYLAGSVLFRTTTGSKLHNALMSSPMSFEIDAWDDAERTGWSVLVKGVSTPVTDETLVALYAHLGVEPWADASARADFVRIRADEITGRGVVHVEGLGGAPSEPTVGT